MRCSGGRWFALALEQRRVIVVVQSPVYRGDRNPPSSLATLVKVRILYTMITTVLFCTMAYQIVRL